MARPKRASSTKGNKSYKDASADGSSEESEWEQQEPKVEETECKNENKTNRVVETKPDAIKSNEPNIKNKRAPWNKGLGKKRPRAHEYDTDEENDEDIMPTCVRLTENGGYAHTKKSRARIGKANKGKSPWNKGKQRSEECKAKIRAGVVARNQAVLAVKLKKLGLTEDEWIAKQKEIKYLRERVRRAKLMASKRKEKITQENLIKLEKELSDALAAENTAKLNTENLDNEGSAAVKENTSGEEEKKEDKPEQPTATPQTFFQQDIVWEPYAHDPNETPQCLSGGPGGLVCCADCSSNFSGFLTATARDAEHQTRHNVGKEVQELLGYMEENRFAMMTAVQVARKQPLPPVVNASSSTQLGPRRNITESWAEPVEWTMTSVMDLSSRRELH